MNGLYEELKDKSVHIRFQSSFYDRGGIVAAEYRVKGCTDGFLQLQDERGHTVFCPLDQIKQITVLPDGIDNGVAL